MKRRDFIVKFFLTSVACVTTVYSKVDLEILNMKKSTFKYIYGNQILKNNFLLFLTNVFNLYPEHELHQLITKVSDTSKDDKEIYLNVQKQLDTISPVLALLHYQLPALMHQKKEMSEQTVTLLGKGTTYSGYMELGSSGRYLDYLEEDVSIKGNRYYVDIEVPGYSLENMVDRGQINIGADFIPLNAYKTDFSTIKSESLDLVCVYIGFHHIPFPLREEFISNIRDTMRSGGKLILRDHDCYDEAQTKMVALAHDVFNMGTHETWEYNENELRNFYPLAFIQSFVEDIGFKLHKEVIYQDGDPTKNALMMFTKV